MDYREYQKMLDPAYLKTVSMNEIYETIFESRPPLIDGLLYSGTYLFVGAPKLGNYGKNRPSQYLKQSLRLSMRIILCGRVRRRSLPKC